jgi:hypothetical protein
LPSSNIGLTNTSLQNHLRTEDGGRSLLPATGRGPRRTGLSPAWLRFAVPSGADLVFVILLLGLSTGPLAVSLLGDGGTGWHIRTGEWILSTHAIPRVDLFSTTMRGKTWYAWEWFYDLLVGALDGVAGLNGVVLLTAFVIALTFAVLLRRVLARGASLPVAVILLLLAFTASTVHFLARPHVLSWLFTVIWFESLERFEAEEKARALLWLPPLMIVWVNVHGGFLVGLILLAIYFVSEVVTVPVAAGDAGRAGAVARARTLAVFGLGAGLATLCNPYGYHLYAHIVQYLSDSFLMHHIDEFMAPRFHSVAQKSFAVLILVGVMTTALSRSRMSLRHWLVLLFAIGSGLYAVRNIPVSSLLVVLIVAPQVSAGLHECAKNRELPVARALVVRLDSFGSRMARFDETLGGHLWPALVTLGLIVVCAVGGSVGGHPLMNAHFDEKRYPVQAVDYLAGNLDARPVFSPDRWGGYLIYRFYPKMVAAVDDRHDLYGSEFLKQYLNIVRGEAGWDAALERLHPGWVVISADSPLSALLHRNAGWKMVYRDQTAEVFRRELH